MNVETLNELGSSRPPKPSWAAALNVELKRIAELEAALGEEPGKPIFNVVSARIRVAKLQAKLEAKQHPTPESEMGPNELGTAMQVAAARANKLEAELGLPKGAPSATLDLARLRVSHLEQLKSAGNVTAAPATLSAPSNLSAPASVPPAELTGRARFVAAGIAAAQAAPAAPEVSRHLVGRARFAAACHTETPSEGQKSTSQTTNLSGLNGRARFVAAGLNKK